MVKKSFLVVIGLAAFGFTKAQQPLIFKVEKPESKTFTETEPVADIYILPDIDTLFFEQEQKLCIVTDNNDRVFEVKFNVNNVNIVKEDFCYTVKLERKKYYNDKAQFDKDTLLSRNYVTLIVDEVLSFTKKRILTRTYLLDEPIQVYEEQHNQPYHKKYEYE